jgi:hypothetical protein
VKHNGSLVAVVSIRLAFFHLAVSLLVFDLMFLAAGCSILINGSISLPSHSAQGGCNAGAQQESAESLSEMSKFSLIGLDQQPQADTHNHLFRLRHLHQFLATIPLWRKSDAEDVDEAQKQAVKFKSVLVSAR